MSKIYFEEKIYPGSEAVLSVNNTAFLYGQSVFTSTVIKNHKALFAKEHLQRTIKGAQNVFLLTDSEVEQLNVKIQNGLEIFLPEVTNESYLRITVFWDHGIKFVLYSNEQTVYYPVLKAKTINKIPRGEFIPEEIKMGTYAEENYLKKMVVREGFNDVLFINGGNVLEFSTGNIFFLRNNIFHTPPKYGIFPGIFRTKLIEALQANGYEVIVKPIEVEELSTYENVFQTNSVKLVTPVDQIDKIHFAINEAMVEHLKNIVMKREEI